MLKLHTGEPLSDYVALPAVIGPPIAQGPAHQRRTQVARRRPGAASTVASGIIDILRV